MEKINDAQKLNGLADWFENQLSNNPYIQCEYDNQGIQKDLREMALKINALGGNVPVFFDERSLFRKLKDWWELLGGMDVFMWWAFVVAMVGYVVYKIYNGKIF